MKLLVIEDSEDVRLLLELELARRGYHVVASASAESALRTAIFERPSVIVSDLGLPGMDGLDLLRRLRADPFLRQTPAIALSGFGRRAQQEDAIAAGYQAVLVKPVDMTDLVEAIEGVAACGGGL
jgi:CheY-like chemotaxis protein